MPRRYARDLRRNQTEAEWKLWSRLRDRRLTGAKFRRQQPIGPYIVDFCCPERKLVVGLDGGQHATRVEADRERTAYLTERGYEVLRFWDNEAICQTDAVMQRIAEAVAPSPSPLPLRGRG